MYTKFKNCFFVILVTLSIPLFPGQKGDYFGTEQIVFEAKQEELAKLMRQLRLSNPYDIDSLSYKVWEEQAQFNIPILILASYYLDEFCQNNQKQRLLFSSRDCCHFV